MIHEYIPLEVKLTTPGQRVFYVQASYAVAEVDGQEMVRHSLKVPVALLPLEWSLSEDAHDRVHLHDLKTWILTSIFDGNMLFDTFPLDGRFYFEITNPDDLMVPAPVGLYEFGQYASFAGGKKQLLLCTTKEPVRNIICRFYPKFFCQYTFASDSWDPRVTSDCRSLFDAVLTASMLYVTTFFFNGDMDEDLSASEWANRTAPHMPWASVESRTEWIDAVNALHKDSLIFEAKSAKIIQELSQLVQEERRTLALQQVRRAAESEVIHALPMVEPGTQIHEEDHLVSLRNGIARATAIFGIHYNFKAEPVRTLLAIKLPAQDGAITLYVGEHLDALLLNLDLTDIEIVANAQKGRL